MPPPYTGLTQPAESAGEWREPRRRNHHHIQHCRHRPRGWFVSSVTVTLVVEGRRGGQHGRPSTGWTGSAGLTYTAPFIIAVDGVHALEYYFCRWRDHSAAHTAEIKADSTTPSSSVPFCQATRPRMSFAVSWSGTDDGGSGVAGYDVQYKDGYLASWRHGWTNTAVTSQSFSLAQRARRLLSEPLPMTLPAIPRPTPVWGGEMPSHLSIRLPTADLRAERSLGGRCQAR